MRYDVVIAGGGFAGAYCARVLGKSLGESRVALIAERNVLVFQPMLAEVVGSSLSPVDVVNPLRQFCRQATVLQGSIQRIDWASKSLILDGGRFTRNHPVQFGQLVLALGSVTDLGSVPGMAEYGWPMKTIADALRLRSALINRLEEANLVEDPVIRSRLLTFVVVGGGYTGVETAGQLYDFVEEAHRFYSNLRGSRLRVVLIHSREQLLGEIGADLGAYATEVLEKRGIEVRLSTRVTEVSASRVHMGSETIEANTVVSTVGSAPNPVVTDLCKQLGIEAPKGRVAVDPTMKVPGFEGLWAIGDGAAVPWVDRGEAKISPPTAQLAVRQGKQVARNILRSMKGETLLPFTYTYMGQLATIGEREAVAEVFGFHFRGFLAWWLWRTIYLAKLPGLLRRLRVVIDWTFDLVFPRDISLLLPPPDDMLRAIHLEKDEVLFRAGEPCRAYFYLRKGSLTLEAAGEPPRVLAAGAVIDQDYLTHASTWAVSLSAAESADVVVIRGRAHELLRNELKLIRRRP